MRKAMGPVLTTGLALVAAAVVVANPVAPPVRDLQISTTQLFTSPEALIPFDKNLLKSISQPSASSNFNVALAQILGALAAEADRISTEVNSDISTPMAPASATANQTPPVPADVPSGATPNGTPSASTNDVPLTVAASAPAIQQVVSDLTAETAYLGNQVVEAAYAAVNALADTPDVIVRAVWAVLVGDLATAFATIVQGIKAFINPGLILVGGVDEVVGQYVAPPINSTPSASAAAANNRRVAAPPAAAVGAAGESATDHPVTTAAEPGSGKPRQTKIAGSATRATTSIDQPQLTPRSSASAPSTGNSSHSAGRADIPEQPKPKTPGADNPGSASSGRSQNAGGRGASAGD